MERLKRNLWIFATCVMVLGLSLVAVPKTKQIDRTEDWIASQLPTKVADFKMVASNTDTTCSYKMDKMTYDTLRPWGIVARIFDNGRQSYDVVVIGSRSKESFHDPKVCFAAQGWNLNNEHIEFIETKTRGRVPVSIVEMLKDGDKRYALYFYKLTQGFVGSNSGVKLQMLKTKLLSFGKDDEGAFIRVIPTHSQPDKEQLKQFVGEWLDASGETSKGYY